ncbi:hypothetical protein NDN08_002095 [Rhodosorus marinus]|uniref:Uncharacterized protein n=1 Tax=Rhodosorus marinus TaxID=101924 RepID=A0AAV8UWW8_9RHOD|nr:hypothetical protein NDN08_002095 [Rhodosorus marinus]
MEPGRVEYMRHQYLDIKEQLKGYDDCRSSMTGLEAIMRTNAEKSDKLEVRRKAAQEKADQSSERLVREKKRASKKVFVRRPYNEKVEEWTLTNKLDLNELSIIDERLESLRAAAENARKSLEDVRLRNEDRLFLEMEKKKVLERCLSAVAADSEVTRCSKERNLALHVLERRRTHQTSQEKALEQMKSAEKNMGLAVENLENAFLCNTKQVVKSAEGRKYNKTDASVARMAMQQARRQVEEAQALAKQAAKLNSELSKTISGDSLGDFSGFKSNAKFDGYGAYRVRRAIKEALKTTRQSSIVVEKCVKQQELLVQECVTDVKEAEEEVEKAETALENQQVRVAFMQTVGRGDSLPR